MFVFPAFKDMFEQQGKQLPAITQFCIDSGEFLKDKWPVIPVAIVVIALTANYLLKWEPSKRKLDEFVLKVPLFSDLIKAAAFSNFLTVLQIEINTRVSLIIIFYLFLYTLIISSNYVKI